MKNTFFAAMFAAAVLGAGLTPAFAGEGNGEPFYNSVSIGTRLARPALAFDTGSAQYPDVVGRPGSNLPRLAGDVLPSNGSEGAVQTANSLPRGFEDGTVQYAQAKSISAWMVAHNRAPASIYAVR
jgi:hypothetical protein